MRRGSNLQGQEMLTEATTWMNPESPVQNEALTKEGKRCDRTGKIPTLSHSETGSGMVVAGGWEGGGRNC